MTISENGINFIKQMEGFRCKAYKAVPTEACYTIGYGHCSADVQPFDRITVEQADKLLIDDVTPLAAKIFSLNGALNQNQLDALVSLAYNIGINAFLQSTCARYVRELHTGVTAIAVARQICRWVYAGDKALYGLKYRRCLEANLFLDRQQFQVVDGIIVE